MTTFEAIMIMLTFGNTIVTLITLVVLLVRHLKGKK